MFPLPVYAERRCFEDGVSLVRAVLTDAPEIWRMEKEAFAPLYQKYRDEGSPYLEPLSKVQQKLSFLGGSYYWITAEGERVGAVWVGVRSPGVFHLGPLFICPRWQNRGFAQAALLQLEALLGPGTWQLDTLLQEPGNCHLYEKLGYIRTGGEKKVNDRLTLIDYEKTVGPPASGQEVQVSLAPVQPREIPLFYEMQIKSFALLRRRYPFDAYSPGAESFETVCKKLRDPAVSLAAFIQVNGVPVGGIRVKDRETDGALLRLLSIIFVLPEHRGQKIAQRAIQLAEQSLPPAARWRLITIKQEPELCHLYEKMGYRPTGLCWDIHPGMDMIQYQKTFLE